MLLAQQGHEESYRQLLQELASAIAAYVRSRFGDSDIVDDCVQESLVAIHQARNSYEAKYLFRPWLFAIVRYKTIDMLRKKNHHPHCGNLTSREDNKNIDDTVDQSIDFDALLSALSATHREAIVLTKVEGFSIREAAAKLCISESAMKVRVHRALDASRQLLKEELH